MRILAAAVFMCCAVIGLARAAGVDAAVRRPTNIPAQALEPALHVFAKERAIQVVYRSEVVGDLKTRGATGELTANEALQQLLDGTGLTFRYLNDGAVTIEPASSLGHPVSTTTTSKSAEAIQLAQAGGSTTAPMEHGNPAEGKNSSATQTERQTEDRSSIQEITVTATKREERAQDVPMSIAVLSNQDIERRGVIGMEDYLRSIPGVNQIDRGGFDNAIVIRGITTSPESENYGSGATVATYFNEVSISGAAGLGGGGIDVRPVDIDRIEVLRGPQGTTFGDASLGGAVRMIAAQPRLDRFNARLGASYSDTGGLGGDNSMIQGVVNIPIVTDRFALRAVGYRYGESGYYRNVAGDDPTAIAAAARFGLSDYVRGHVADDVGRMVSTGGRLAALWQVTDGLDLSLTYLKQTIEQDGSPIAEVGEFEQVRVPIAAQGRVRGKAGEVNDNDIDLLSFVLNYDLGWAALTSSGSWIDSGAAVAAAIERSSVAVFGPSSQTLRSEFDSFTAETRVASKLSGPFQFLGGLFYQDVDEGYVKTIDYPGDPATNPYGTTPMYVQEIGRQLDQRAIFGELSYALTSRLLATAGGRYFTYDKERTNFAEGGIVRVPIGAGVRQLLDNSESQSTFKANLRYKIGADSLVYASWSQGFRLGQPSAGANPVLCDSNGDGLVDSNGISIESTHTIDSDSLDSYELGSKFTLLNHRLVVNAAAYHITWQGLPVGVTLPGAVSGTVCSYTANVGKATSDGVEIQASIFPTKDLRLDIGAGYVNAELAEDALAQNWHKGDRLPGAPKVNANLGAQYDFDLLGYSAFVRVDSMYAGEFFGSLPQTPGTRAGDYVKVDARAGLAIKKLSVELFVRNLTDDDSFTWRRLREPNNPFFGYRLRPRTIGVQLGYSFN